VSGMSPSVAAELTRRLKSLPLLKTVGITAFMCAFFAGYFATLNHPLFRVRYMPQTGFDCWLGFQPWAVSLYCSLWLYVLIPPALIGRARELLRYGAVAGLLALTGLVIFLLWPTKVATQGTGFLKRVDLGGNACPSLHVAFAVFSAICISRLFRGLGVPGYAQVLNWLWCAAILYSTLATKQHVLLDLAAGSVVGWGVTLWYRGPLAAQTGAMNGSPAATATNAARY
jgi:membrane-associated phospholipid phosphatase